LFVLARGFQRSFRFLKIFFGSADILVYSDFLVRRAIFENSNQIFS